MLHQRTSVLAPPQDRPAAPHARSVSAHLYPRRTSAWATAILLAMLAAMVLGSTYAAAEELRTVIVTGTAEERVAPDMALISVAAVADSPDAKTARREADKTIAAALSVINGLGIASNDVDTSGLEVSPQYRWIDKTGERELTGYRVARSIEIRLLDLSLVGELLTGLSDAGVNQMSSPVLGLVDREAVHQRVLAAAATNAQERATVLAETLGADLGKVMLIGTPNANYPRPMAREAMMMSAAAADIESNTYQSADLSFRVNISVTFELK